MKFFDLLRTIIAWPFLAVAWIFYKIYEFVDPYVEWELDHYGTPIFIVEEDDDWDDFDNCCEDCN
jgi:hypothetical protein